MSYVLGVDGGTSKTKALISRIDGTIVGHSLTGGSNIYDSDPQARLANAMLAPELAVEAAGLRPEDIDFSVFSMSGADWSEDMVLFRSAARARSFGRQIRVVNDAIGGLYAGLPRLSAVAVICGTHAACAARNDSGEIWHNSFWQLVGGAYDLGQAALKAVYTQELGITPATSLTPALLEYFDQSSVPELLHRQTALFADPFPSLANLAPLVIDHAGSRDAVALEIVISQGRELGRYALAAARKVDIVTSSYDLVLGGSVFQHTSAILPDAIASTMRESSPEVNVIFSQHEPVVGALFLALEEAGALIDESLISRIVETLPPGWY
jgi:N-acetylglucosamine kinase-like BadF-type ATPase